MKCTEWGRMHYYALVVGKHDMNIVLIDVNIYDKYAWNVIEMLESNHLVLVYTFLKYRVFIAHFIDL